MLCNYWERQREGESILCMNTCSFFSPSFLLVCSQTRGAFLFLQHFPPSIYVCPFVLNVMRCWYRGCVKINLSVINGLEQDIIQKYSPQSNCVADLCSFFFILRLFLDVLSDYIIDLCFTSLPWTTLSCLSMHVCILRVTAFMGITCVKIQLSFHFEYFEWE